jgi:hypothetical protein
VGQMVEHLPSKHNVLSSKLNTIKNKQTNEQKNPGYFKKFMFRDTQKLQIQTTVLPFVLVSVHLN